MGKIIAIALIVLIVGGAILYIIKAKKSGKKCIGCPGGCCNCGSKTCNCNIEKDDSCDCDQDQ